RCHPMLRAKPVHARRRRRLVPLSGHGRLCGDTVLQTCLHGHQLQPQSILHPERLPGHFECRFFIMRVLGRSLQWTWRWRSRNVLHL
ncbi:hypothetical protein AAVH_41807, partial [Aphelenchoides avenae]